MGCLKGGLVQRKKLQEIDSCCIVCLFVCLFNSLLLHKHAKFRNKQQKQFQGYKVTWTTT